MYVIDSLNFFCQWGITPLRDNMITDQNFYIIKVFTGMRRGAGTASRIAFILTGQKGESGSRELFDGIRKVYLYTTTFVYPVTINLFYLITRCRIFVIYDS